jgi:hypothetical protein
MTTDQERDQPGEAKLAKGLNGYGDKSPIADNPSSLNFKALSQVLYANNQHHPFAGKLLNPSPIRRQTSSRYTATPAGAETPSRTRPP